MNKFYLNIYYKNNYAEFEIKAGQWTAAVSTTQACCVT